MKMTAFYVVYRSGTSNDDVDYVAGPFRFYNDAYQWMFEQAEKNGLTVLELKTEVSV